MRNLGPALAVALVTAAGGASAAETTFTYSGVVSEIIDPSAAPGVYVGEPVQFSATFDLSNKVNVSSTFYNIDAISGLPVSVPGLSTVSIATDPLASYDVKIGGHEFTQAEDLRFGQDFGLGAGKFPFFVFNGDTPLGLAMAAVDGGGFGLGTDPIAKLLHYYPATGVGGDDGVDGFLVATSLDANIAAAAVPEPGPWSLMVLGFAGLGALLRSRGLRRRDPVGPNATTAGG